MPRPTTLDPIITTLRTTRQRRAIPQATIAYAAGVDRTSVTGWENGRVQPPLPRLRAWAAALGYQLVLVTEPAPCPPGQNYLAGAAQSWGPITSTQGGR